MYDKLWKDIKNKKFSSLYLLYGVEKFLIDKTKNLIISEALTDEELEFNLSNYDLEEISIEAALEDCETVPFFGDRKVVIMHNPYFLTAEKVKEKVEHNLKMLDAYLADPVPTSIVVFIAPYEKLDERKKITKNLIKNATVLQANNLSEAEIKNWIEHQFRMNGKQIESSAIERLYHLVGANMAILNKEIDKLLLYTNEGETVALDTIDLLVSRSLEENIFALVDKVVHRKLAGALEIYYDLLKQNEEPIKILAVIANQFRFIYQVKALLKKGYAQKQIASSLRTHPYRVKLAIDQTRLFDDEWLLKLIHELSELDYKMKTGYGNKEKLLELFFIRFLTK
ncbi:DNA polymerase III subunit delta [Caldibacillus lycopersici]|uniref:DNA polymerase III subunit delta n=1 Tax=Perspicuibacillus lycopersici TaxID=1325689 RepID=A0AAE3IST9_9BACI|nr:DNA polymerase III subunit delta [Perspicuibacillus lycopersici]MCU9613940.1 DNA polymerase III subunit delta [Perspicuibacillus lycopersici]